MKDEIDKMEKQSEIDRKKFNEEKKIPTSVNHIDIFQLNIGGEIMMTTRETLTKIPKSILFFYSMVDMNINYKEIKKVIFS